MNQRHNFALVGSLLWAGALVPIAVAQLVRPAPVPHDLAGRDSCLMCHQVGAMEAVTDITPNHADWANITCLWCHATDSPMLTIDPPVIPHITAGRDDCLMCHAPGAMEPVTDTPPSHEGRQSEHCRMCHMPAEST